MLLRASEAARLSSETQDAFRQAEASNGVLEWMDLVEPLVERPVLRAYSLDAGAELPRLRYEANTHPELRQHAHWLRYNRARPVPFDVGDLAPVRAVKVHHDSQPRSLDILIPANRPALIVASSRT